MSPACGAVARQQLHCCCCCCCTAAAAALLLLLLLVVSGETVTETAGSGRTSATRTEAQKRNAGYRKRNPGV